MTIKPATLELRNLLGKGPEGVKCCSICGKPESRATAAVKALPHHAAAMEKDLAGRTLPEQYRAITKYLGVEYVDFENRKKFNAQLASVEAKLTAAREEHDAYVPTAATVSDKAALMETLGQTLRMLGVEPRTDKDATPLLLADALHMELAKLMSIKAEVAAEMQPEEQGPPTIAAPEVIPPKFL